MSKRTKIKSAEGRLKHLYVILGRICNNEQYIWEGMNHEEEFDRFLKEYEALLYQKSESGNKLEDRFTLKKVLTGTISQDDRERKLLNELTISGEEIEINGETILHRAISFIGNTEDAYKQNLNDIIGKIIQDLPFLLKSDRRLSPEYDGQIPLHLAVLKEDIDLVKKITTVMKKQNEKMETEEYSLDIVASGSKFKDTVMMAGTPLCVAALTLNKHIFKRLVKDGADMFKTNRNEDNMCHSLIHYARCCPERLDSIREMIDFILKTRWAKISKKSSNDTMKLLMMENKDGMNPLQLATKFRLHDIFKQLYGFEVYCERHLCDSLRDDHRYDVTEIETIPVGDDNMDNGEKSPGNRSNHASVLPAILLQNPQSAIAFLECPPVRQVIELKWIRYRLFIAVLGMLHLAFMIFLTYYATKRSELTNDFVSNTDLSNPPNYKYRVREDVFVTIASGFGVLYWGICMGITIKTIYTNWNKKVVKKTTLIAYFKYPHSNLIYRLLFILLSLCLLFDFIFAIARCENYENYCLVVAVIIGWYLLLFFIQMIKPFSFFTALIQTVMIDLLRFAVVMFIMLIGFSTAMYMAMQGANTEDDTFERYDSAMMKMFTIMIGLGDLDSLFLARQPALAILIFTVFVLMTTILLLNAVLAIMSNTCSSLLSRYGNITAHSLHYRLQKLSAILLVEDALPVKLRMCVGDVRYRKRYMNDKWYPCVKRRMLYHTSLASNTPDEAFSIPGLATSLFGYLKGHSKKSKGKKKTISRVAPNSSLQLNGTRTYRDIYVDVHTMTSSVDVHTMTSPINEMQNKRKDDQMSEPQ